MTLADLIISSTWVAKNGLVARGFIDPKRRGRPSPNQSFATYAIDKKLAERERGRARRKAKQEDVKVAVVVPSECWCGCTIDKNNECCRVGHRVFDDDGSLMSTQGVMQK